MVEGNKHLPEEKISPKSVGASVNSDFLLQLFMGVEKWSWQKRGRIN